MHSSKKKKRPIDFLRPLPPPPNRPLFKTSIYSVPLIASSFLSACVEPTPNDEEQDLSTPTINDMQREDMQVEDMQIDAELDILGPMVPPLEDFDAPMVPPLDMVPPLEDYEPPMNIPIDYDLPPMPPPQEDFEGLDAQPPMSPPEDYGVELDQELDMAIRPDLEMIPPMPPPPMPPPEEDFGRPPRPVQDMGMEDPPMPPPMPPPDRDEPDREEQ